MFLGFIIGFILGVCASIPIIYYQKEIKDYVNIKFILTLISAKPTIISYSFNTQTNVLTLEYSDGSNNQYFREQFGSWRNLPDMSLCEYTFEKQLDAYIKKIEFENNTL